MNINFGVWSVSVFIAELSAAIRKSDFVELWDIGIGQTYWYIYRYVYIYIYIYIYPCFVHDHSFLVSKISFDLFFAQKNVNIIMSRHFTETYYCRKLFFISCNITRMLINPLSLKSYFYFICNYSLSVFLLF